MYYYVHLTNPTCVLVKHVPGYKLQNAILILILHTLLVGMHTKSLFEVLK